MKHPLLIDINRFLKENADVSAYTLGFKSIKNGRLVERLKEGGDVGEMRAVRVRAWMSEYEARKSPQPEKAGP